MVLRQEPGAGACGDPGELVPAASTPGGPEAARWVQDKIRYVAIEAGEGGDVPREPPLVARRLYGDCKDKTFLLMALMARRQIESYPVLTRPRDSGAIDPAFPSPVQFNHVILAVRVAARTGLPAEIPLADGPVVLFDPTDAWTPWGELPGELQGARGLVVRPNGAELVDFPWAPAGVNRLSRTVRADLGGDGHLRASVTDTTAGSLSQRGFYEHLAPEARQEAVMRFAEDAIPGSRASNLALVHLDDLARPFEDAIRRRVRRLPAPGPAPCSCSRCCPSRSARTGFPSSRSAVRPSPSAVRARGSSGSSGSCRRRCGSRRRPIPSRPRTPTVYRLAAAVKDGLLVVTETFEVRKPEIPVSDLAAWKALESASVKGAGARVVLLRNWTRRDPR